MATDYGTDISTFAGVGCDLDPTFALITGPRVVLEHVARGLVGELRGALNADVDNARLLVIKAACERVATDDERVLSAEAEVTFLLGQETAAVSVRVDLVEGETFTLVLQVSAVTADIVLQGLP